MKPLTVIAIIVIWVTGCNSDHTNSTHIPTLVPIYSITDTSGNADTTFHSGEQFILSFSVTNTTGDTLILNLGWPAVAFRIFGNDSMVSSSDFNCPIPLIASGKGWLAPGQSIKDSWKGPTSPCDTQQVVLTPGFYQAKVTFPTILNVKMKPVSVINISVVR